MIRCLKHPFSFCEGRLHLLLGLNGSGKSTWMNTLASGAMKMGSETFLKAPPWVLAQRRACLAQESARPEGLLVRECLELGAYPWALSASSPRVQGALEEAMDFCELADFMERPLHLLSGGEAQRVQLARVLVQAMLSPAQRPAWLFLDEPFAHLDVQWKHILFEGLLQLGRTRSHGILMVSHDIDLALHYADTVTFVENMSPTAQYEADDPRCRPHAERVFGVQMAMSPFTTLNFTPSPKGMAS